MESAGRSLSHKKDEGRGGHSKAGIKEVPRARQDTQPLKDKGFKGGCPESGVTMSTDQEIEESVTGKLFPGGKRRKEMGKKGS